MCGRYTLVTPVPELAERFLVAPPELDGLQPRYNVAPGQDVLALAAGSEGGRIAALRVRWGLVPPWSRDGRPGPINARSETAASRAMFRRAFRLQRCLVPADGFYEWIREPVRIPVRFTLADGRPFAFAGLWERWSPRAGSELLTCCILTTRPNDLVRPIHDRMPVILRPEDERLWLDVGVADPDALCAACEPYPADRMRGYTVSTRVNSPRNDDPGCILPVA